MSRIQVLDGDTINRIAAGEVVEGAKSVVKELVENALDAGATRVEVDLEAGGSRLVRVTDDGCGMSEEDALLSLERHATSKLTTAHDLQSIRTMGFRGEAVPAIASISRMTILTRERGADAGTRLEVAGGRVDKVERAAARPGTKMEVRHLFFNTPARKKFLRSKGAETSAIREIMADYLLARPDVAFRLRSGRETLLATPGELTAGEALERVLAKGEPAQFVEFPASTHPSLPFTVEGFLGKSALTRSNSRGIRLFVNGRPFYSGLLCRALLEAYRNFLPKRRWPAAVLFVEADPRAVDVNVHPAKKEVRFTGFEKLQEWLIGRVREVLTEEVAPRITSLGAPIDHVEAPGADERFWSRPEPTAGEGARASSPAPVGEGTREGAGVEAPEAAGEEDLASRPRRGAAPVADSRSDLPGGPASPARGSDLPGRPASPARGSDFLGRPASPAGRRETAAAVRLFDPAPYKDLGTEAPDLVGPAAEAPAAAGQPVRGKLFPGGVRVLGQVFASFILVTDDEKIYYVDQHVAHERVLFEHFSESLRRETPPVQNLLIPLEIKIAPHAADVLVDRAGDLERYGFGVRVEGDRAFVTSVPLFPRAVAFQEVLEDMVEGLSEVFAGNPMEEEIEAMADMMSCKAAIKAGARMSPGEMGILLEQLFECEYPLTCPHGRPIILGVEEAEVRRRFLRSG